MINYTDKGKIIIDDNVKTVDLYIKRYWDRVNGNSYFSAQLVINYDMEDHTTIYIPFQYGYDSMPEQVATTYFDNLNTLWKLKSSRETWTPKILRVIDYKYTKQKEVKEWGRTYAVN